MRTEVEKRSTDRARLGRMCEALTRSWFELTAHEQAAVMVILGLLLFGLAVRLVIRG